jgi:hypothetical protein
MEKSEIMDLEKMMDEVVKAPINPDELIKYACGELNRVAATILIAQLRHRGLDFETVADPCYKFKTLVRLDGSEIRLLDRIEK